MKAADEASNKAEATRLRRKLHSLITYGEKLKKSIDPKLLTEHQILRDASRLYGANFPPWRAEPQGDEFSLDPSGQLFT
jgi:calpain-7